jgi:hypothetical protein
MRNGSAQVNGSVALVQEAQSILSGINALMTAAVRRVPEIAVADRNKRKPWARSEPALRT